MEEDAQSELRALANLLRKLTGKDSDKWSKALDRFLDEKNPWEEPKTLVVIKLGTFKDVKSLRSAIGKAEISIINRADDILGRVTLAEAESLVELVVFSVEELGFPDGATYTDIYNAARKQGLCLCPAEVGPQLALQYGNQLENGWVVIAMEPIKNFKNPNVELYLFSVGRGIDTLWLDAVVGRPDCFLISSCRFFFVRSEKKSP